MSLILHSKIARDIIKHLLTNYIEDCKANDLKDHTDFINDLFKYLRHGKLSKNFKKRG